jgi:cysteine desulfurase
MWDAMANKKKVYLDYAATTPLDQRVLGMMLPYFDVDFGNPSSIHHFGQIGESAVEGARESIAIILNAQLEEIIFTSCGSESDNLALRGVALAAKEKRKTNHLLISPVEHHAVSKTALQLAKTDQFEMEYLPVDRYGIVSPDEVEKRLRPETVLVSVIYANNEIGTINPIAEIGSVCRTHGVPFHTDAVQAGAALSLDVEALNVDLMSLGAHKFYGPKGVGVLYIRKGTPLLPIQTGGKQEFGFRAGTHNVPYIVGFAGALRFAEADRDQYIANIKPWRDYLIGQLLEEIPDSRLTGHPSQRLPNHVSLVMKNIDGNQLLTMLDVAGFACSSGSACKTGSPEPSEILTAIGLTDDWALGSLRVTLGKHTTKQDVTEFKNLLPEIVRNMRKNPNL